MCVYVCGDRRRRRADTDIPMIQTLRPLYYIRRVYVRLSTSDNVNDNADRSLSVRCVPCDDDVRYVGGVAHPDVSRMGREENVIVLLLFFPKIIFLFTSRNEENR